MHSEAMNIKTYYIQNQLRLIVNNTSPIDGAKNFKIIDRATSRVSNLQPNRITLILQSLFHITFNPVVGSKEEKITHH